MATELNLKVQATDLSKHQFVPASLKITIGLPNDDLQTCAVSFELTDDGLFDETQYTWLQRVHKGGMNVPLAVIALLINTDGSYNTAVINQWLGQSALELI
jgi:hypothetical protein